jgi:hypothetical protein
MLRGSSLQGGRHGARDGGDASDVASENGAKPGDHERIAHWMAGIQNGGCCQQDIKMVASAAAILYCASVSTAMVALIHGLIQPWH